MTSDPIVEQVDSAVYTVPTDTPEADGTLSRDSTTLILATVRCGAVTGLGFTYAPAATARVVDDLLAGVVTGTGAFDVPAANEAMQRAVRNAGLPGVSAQAVSAVDIALWDLKARLLGLPLVRVLGAACREVPVYGSGGFTSYDADRRCCCSRQPNGSSAWTARPGGPPPSPYARSRSTGASPTRGSGNWTTGCGPTAGWPASPACAPWRPPRRATRWRGPVPAWPTPCSAPRRPPACTPPATGSGPPVTREWTPRCCYPRFAAPWR
ncbi:hypothetical protein GCM10018793_58200 [Streptomyces sulfonofaciens]|uniref:Mandelate racemase/muconate lactonizing enzyme N-terminal domain-containing protein n=1 Tax=Streptomyces sulfonofaciens TaxID=68272 RepID=A0A919L747_9ACTN|nr:hypothetical protein GCM10018793_58200 [Streptomyces sulfonofaciens]